jgi:spoIIIJ-associated protein
MPKSIIAEGKTTTEAISKGLKELNVSKDKVNIKIIEEHNKKSFFSILDPRVVKVELTLKNDEEIEEKHTEKKKVIEISDENLLKAENKIKKFLDEFRLNFSDLDYNLDIDKTNAFIKVNLSGNDSKNLIGYRGDVLNSLQTILNTIANSDIKERARVTLNIGNYREKREKALEELADKLSKTVLRTGKSITLEPMMAYERKIIHNRLQSSNKVKTHSVGEEPYRRVVIEKK